jgi:transposase
MARHYDTAIMPARVRTPQDKAKAEQMVQQAERQILAPMRDQTFFSLQELNEAIAEGLLRVNQADFQKLPYSRLALFNDLDKPALKALPLIAYEYAEWIYAKVDGGYHIELASHYYSVPYRYAHKTVDIRYASGVVQIFFKSKLIALHQRSYQKGGRTSLPEHMPKGHRAYFDTTPESVKADAEKVGVFTKALVDALFKEREHSYIAMRASVGILSLAKHFGEVRLEKACERALFFGLLTVKSIESILKSGLDTKPLPGSKPPNQPTVTQQTHQNIRDTHYYC